ncbi:MAG: hypothetical protein ACFFAN_03190 [Promethearchaeota archaeon]
MFEIDEKGRVICKSHSKYDFFIKPKDYFQDLYLDIELTCKTCVHYQNNDCYFSKSRIDIIEYKRQRRESYFCKFCRKKIERMFSIIYKLYYKEIFDVEIPLICCDCYEKINKDEFLSYCKKMTDFYLLNIVISVFIFSYFIFLLSLLDIQPILNYIFFITLFSVVSFILLLIIFKSIKKLRYLIYGIKYYKKHFSNINQTHER